MSVRQLLIINRLGIRSGSSFYYKPSRNWVYSVAVCSKTDEVTSKKRNCMKQGTCFKKKKHIWAAAIRKQESHEAAHSVCNL